MVKLMSLILRVYIRALGHDILWTVYQVMLITMFKEVGMAVTTVCSQHLLFKAHLIHSSIPFLFQQFLCQCHPYILIHLLNVFMLVSIVLSPLYTFQHAAI